MYKLFFQLFSALLTICQGYAQHSRYAIHISVDCEKLFSLSACKCTDKFSGYPKDTLHAYSNAKLQDFSFYFFLQVQLVSNLPLFQLVSALLTRHFLCYCLAPLVQLQQWFCICNNQLCGLYQMLCQMIWYFFVFVIYLV